MKIGDVVRLKSGGPKMTVVAQSGTEWGCNWWHDGEYGYRTFQSEALEIATDPSPSTPPQSDPYA